MFDFYYLLKSQTRILSTFFIGQSLIVFFLMLHIKILSANCHIYMIYWIQQDHPVKRSQTVTSQQFHNESKYPKQVTAW